MAICELSCPLGGPHTTAHTKLHVTPVLTCVWQHEMSLWLHGPNRPEVTVSEDASQLLPPSVGN